MAIKFKCRCGRSLTAKDEYEGQKSKCPVCGAMVVVPKKVTRIAPDLPPEGLLEPGNQTVKFCCDCGKHIRARVDQIGKRVGCPRCGHALVVPPGRPSAAPAPRQEDSTAETKAVRPPSFALEGSAEPDRAYDELDSSYDIDFASREDLGAAPKASPPPPSEPMPSDDAMEVEPREENVSAAEEPATPPPSEAGPPSDTYELDDSFEDVDFASAEDLGRAFRPPSEPASPSPTPNSETPEPRAPTEDVEKTETPPLFHLDSMPPEPETDEDIAPDAAKAALKTDYAEVAEEGTYDVAEVEPSPSELPMADISDEESPPEAEGPATPKLEGSGKCPYCGKRIEPGAVVCTYCGRYTRTGAAVAVSGEVAEADESIEGIRQRELSSYFNAVGPIDAAWMGMLHVRHGMLLYLIYACLSAATARGVVLLRHYAADGSQGLLVGQILLACASMYFLAAFLGCIKDSVFQRYLGIERFFYHGGRYFLWFTLTCLVIAPAYAGIGLGCAALIRRVAAASAGFFGVLLVAIVLGLVAGTLCLALACPIVVGVVEAADPIRALGRGLGFAFRHFWKLAGLVVSLVVVSGMSVGGLYFLLVFVTPMFLRALPPPVYDTIQVMIGSFFYAALLGLASESLMLFYLSNLGDEEKLQQIQGTTAGPGANALLLRGSVVVLVGMVVGAGYWVHRVGAGDVRLERLMGSIRKASTRAAEQPLASEGSPQEYRPLGSDAQPENWTEYVNHLWGFSFRYPPQWEIAYEVYTPPGGGEAIAEPGTHRGSLEEYGVTEGGGLKLLDPKTEAEYARVIFQKLPFSGTRPKSVTVLRSQDDEHIKLAFNVRGEYELRLLVSQKAPRDAQRTLPQTFMFTEPGGTP